METVAERERCGALLLAAVEPALSRGAMVQCMALLCNARKSKNAVRLGGVSELLAQFSGAVRGLSTERHCAMAMQTPRKPSHAWRSERTVGFAFCGGTPSRRRTRIIFRL